MALRPLAKGMRGEVAGVGELEVREAIPRGHKLAVVDVAGGELVRKYGEVIGVATCDIGRGSWVHSHNLQNPARSAEIPERLTPSERPDEDSQAALERATFRGYVREDGTVGTRNYIVVIPSVHCSVTVACEIAERFSSEELAQWPHVDGVVALGHHGGCGLPRGGLQWKLLSRLLQGMMRHPNVAAALVVGLGCEQLAVDDVVRLEVPGAAKRRRVETLVMQQVGGTRAAVERGEAVIRSWLPEVNRWRREVVPARHLVVATECGGSDAFSGVTANPAVGRAINRLVACGGTGVLSETPEVAGAEQVLLRRAATPEVARALLERLSWWEWYAGVFGAQLDQNPSPGNKAGGLTTIAEKSLGAILKGGSTPLEAVVPYGAEIPRGGLVFMDTPGFDPPSVTGMVAGGANLVVFTTGRGSCFGAAAAPTLKVATTRELARAMPEDIDIDAGGVLEGEPIDAVGEAIFRRMLEVASGEPTASESLGYGRHEFVPWAIGPVL